MPPIRKRSTIDISVKQQIIKDRQNGDLVKTIMHRYKLSNSTVCTILQNRDKILNRNFVPGVVYSGNLKKRTALTEAMEIQVIAWLKSDEVSDRTVSGSEIRKKAKEIHSKLLAEKLAQPSSSSSPDEPLFTASTGWLQNFHLRLQKKLKETVSSPPCSPFHGFPEGKFIDQIINQDVNTII